MHYGGHWRSAFHDWANCQEDVAIVEVNYESEEWPAEKLLRAMLNCSDVMPWMVCEDCDVPQGSSYGYAAQQLLARMRSSA